MTAMCSLATRFSPAKFPGTLTETVNVRNPMIIAVLRTYRENITRGYVFPPLAKRDLPQYLGMLEVHLNTLLA